MFRNTPHILWTFGRGKLCRWAVHSKEADIRKRVGQPLSTHTFDWPQLWFIGYIVSPANLRLGPAWKHADIAEYRISCVGTNIRLRQRHPQNTPSWPPPPNPTLQHQIVMQEQLKLWKAAGLEQVWECTICLPRGCKMVPKWPMARTPRPHLAFSHSAWLFATNVHVAHGWVWKWGEQGGRKANWSCLGGWSSGGDDQGDGCKWIFLPYKQKCNLIVHLRHRLTVMTNILATRILLRRSTWERLIRLRSAAIGKRTIRNLAAQCAACMAERLKPAAL